MGNSLLWELKLINPNILKEKEEEKKDDFLKLKSPLKVFYKISALQFLWFGIDSVLKILNKRIAQSVNELITKVFIEQPRLHRVC